MGEKMKRITGSLYWRQFMLTAGMVLLTMALLGVSFYALSYNYTVLGEAAGDAGPGGAGGAAVRGLSYRRRSTPSGPGGRAALSGRRGTLRMTDVDFLICDTSRHASC